MFTTDRWEYGLPPGRVKGRRSFMSYGMNLVQPAHPWSGSRRKPSQERYIARLNTRYMALPPAERQNFLVPIKANGARAAKRQRQVEAQYVDAGL